MAYQTGTATGPEDLLDKLFTFASSNGWTINESTTGTRAHFNRNNIYVGFYYTSSILKIYPARGYSSSTEPNAQPNAAYTDTLSDTTTGCIVNQMTGPYDAYWFFESDTYLHVVVNTSNNIYRHFGFGEIVQSGNIIGGEYFYGHYHDQAASKIDQPLYDSHSHPFAGNSNGLQLRYSGSWFYGRKNTSPETVLSGGTSANTKWYNSFGNATTYDDADGADLGLLNVSGVGSGRGSNILSVGSSNLNGFVALYSINFFVRDNSTIPDSIYPQGSPPDVRLVSLRATTDQQELTIGSDTWKVFPISKRGITSTEESTGNLGLAYKKVTT